MKHTERWLVVSIIIIGLTVILLGIRLLRDYSGQVRRANTTTENMNTATNTGSTDSASLSVTEEQPYGKIIQRLGGIELVEMPEPIYTGGYKLEVTGVDITRKNEGWLLDDGVIPYCVENWAENGDILSEEQYVVVHIKLTAYEEYYPYVQEGMISEICVGNMRFHTYTEQQEAIDGWSEAVGLSESDGTDYKSLYMLNLEFGETRELDVIFLDSEKILLTEENPILVLTYNPSGGNVFELEKGMVLHVPD